MTAVVHIITALERGGAQRNTLETAVRLHDPGRPQIVVTGPRTSGGLSLDTEAEARLGTRLLRVESLVPAIHPLADAQAAMALTALLERLAATHGTPLLVHTHSSKAGVLGRLAARAVRGCLALHTVHGFGIDALGSKRRALLLLSERVAAHAADAVVFVSDGDRATAAELGLFAGLPQHTIRSGIDERAFAVRRDDAGARTAARAAFGVADERPLALTTGNLKAQKDPLFHLDILAAWRARAPDNARPRLLFLGDGPLRTDVERRAHALGVSNDVLLPGFVADPRPALLAADVFLLASLWEGLPRAVLEALASGLPCVVRDTGYAPDLAFARGLVALPLHAPPEAFAAALHKAIGKKVSTRGGALPRAFTLDGMLEDLGRLYDDMVGPPRPVGVRVARRRPTRARGPR